MSNRDHEPGGVDWLDLGPDPDEGKPPATPRRRYLWYGGAAALVAVALLLTRTQNGANEAATSANSPSQAVSSSSPSRAVPSSSGSSGSFVNPTGLPTGAASLPSRPPTQVTNLGRPLLDAPADWELFARGPGVVYRIQLALGRITATAVPEPAHDSSVMFFAGSDRAIVRALDDSPGYVVRDGKPAAELPLSLAHRLVMLPSRDQQHLWTEATAGDQTRLALVKLDGAPTGVTIDIPQDAFVQGSDGAGHVLLTGIGGWYHARPGSMHRITGGLLVATGPTRWLTVECDDSFSCANVVTDRASGARRTLNTPVDHAQQQPGMISPDGKTAALLKYVSDGGIHLLDLGSGLARSVAATISETSFQSGVPFVWSPDSRWLFVIDGANRVLIVNRDTGRATPLGTRLTPVIQLAVRHGRG